MNPVKLDLKNLLCPLPVIKAEERADMMAAGEILEITATDPGTEIDIPAWARINGHKLIRIEKETGLIGFYVEIGRRIQISGKSKKTN